MISFMALSSSSRAVEDLEQMYNWSHRPLFSSVNPALRCSPDLQQPAPIHERCWMLADSTTFADEVLIKVLSLSRLAWPGRLACPLPEIVNMRGRQQGTAPLNIQAHGSTMKLCPIESVFVTKAAGGSRFTHQSGEPGEVLTGAASPRTTDVCGIAGSRSEMVYLDRDARSTPVATYDGIRGDRPDGLISPWGGSR